jgi:hypothetical protein
MKKIIVTRIGKREKRAIEIVRGLTGGTRVRSDCRAVEPNEAVSGPRIIAYYDFGERMAY